MADGSSQSNVATAVLSQPTTRSRASGETSGSPSGGISSASTLFDHPSPDLPPSTDRRLVLQLREVDPALLLRGAVALDAMLGQERPDLVAERRRVRPLPSGDPGRGTVHANSTASPNPRLAETSPIRPIRNSFPSLGLPTRNARLYWEAARSSHRPGWTLLIPLEGNGDWMTVIQQPGPIRRPLKQRQDLSETPRRP